MRRLRDWLGLAVSSTPQTLEECRCEFQKRHDPDRRHLNSIGYLYSRLEQELYYDNDSIRAAAIHSGLNPGAVLKLWAQKLPAWFAKRTLEALRYNLTLAIEADSDLPRREFSRLHENFEAVKFWFLDYRVSDSLFSDYTELYNEFLYAYHDRVFAYLLQNMRQAREHKDYATDWSVTYHERRALLGLIERDAVLRRRDESVLHVYEHARKLSAPLHFDNWVELRRTVRKAHVAFAQYGYGFEDVLSGENTALALTLLT